MPLIAPPKHTGLIVIALWQNNFAHPELRDFEQETRAVVEGDVNLSLEDVKGGVLPCLIHESLQPLRRFAVWVARLQEEESANALEKRLRGGWVGLNQNGIVRRIELGNGHQQRMNYSKVDGIRSAKIYALAFDELKAPGSASAVGEAREQVDAIVVYLRKLMRASNT